MGSGYSIHSSGELNSADIPHIVALHSATFRHGLTSQLGEDFLVEYYDMFRRATNCGIITCKHNAISVGFITFVGNNQRDEIKQLMNKYKKRILMQLMLFKINPLAILRYMIKKIKSKKIQAKAELTSFAVSTEHQRKGIGEQLLTAMEDELRDLGVFEYSVYTDNEEGYMFYQKKQFECIFSFTLFGTTSACFKKKL